MSIRLEGDGATTNRDAIGARVEVLVEPETIRKAQSGDAEAFSEIVRRYRRRIAGTIYRLIGRSDDVEDVSQEVFVRLYYSLEQLRAAEVFEPWLYRLTTNAAYDYLRKRRRSADVRMADLSEEQVIAVDAAGGERRSESLFHRFGLTNGQHTVRIAVRGEPYAGSTEEKKGRDIVVDNLIVFR